MVNKTRSILQTPPGKVIWTIIATTLTLIKLPLWLLYYIPSRLRPHPKLTYRQALSQQLFRTYIYHLSLTEIQTPTSLEPGAEKERFVLINPPETNHFQGISTGTDIQPAAVAGTWTPTPYQRKSGGEEQTVVLYLHGGAFVVGAGRTALSGFVANILATNLNASVLSICYRLSSNPNCEFPAALQDAVSAYHYLLSLAIPAHHIIIAGDSAGSNLATALLRYIADNPANLPHPRAALLGSPWIDLASALDPDIMDKHPSAVTDYLPGNFTAWGARAYVPRQLDAASPYISPLNHPFHTATILWVCVGGLEILREHGVKFVDNMRAKGNRITLYVEPFASHSFLSIGNVTGFEREAEDAVKHAAEWIRECESEEAS